MARPVTIRDQDILDAARAVFLENGIRATTADVAKRAGVSEGTVFNRFKTKFDLFRAAMGSDEFEPEWSRGLDHRVGKGDMQESLTDLGMQVLRFFQVITPLIMMSWSNPGPNGPSELFSSPNHPALRSLKRLSGYLEAEMRLGRLRRMDPEVVARTFIGALHNYAALEIFMKASEVLPMPAETYVRGLIHMVWTGLEPKPERKHS